MTLGNGWWSAGLGWESLGKAARPYHPLRLLLDLVALDPEAAAREADAEPRRLVTSDDAWQWRPGWTRRDPIYHGQHVDLAAKPEPWRPVALLDDDGFAPRLGPAPAEPIRVTDTLVPRAIRRLPTGSWLFDFGQNHAGRPRLRLDVPAGTTLSLTHCEVLDDAGRPYLENYRTAAVTDRLTADDGPLDFTPSFSYRGYRYAELRGLPDGFEPTNDTLVSQVLHNVAPSPAALAAATKRFNAIDRIVRWGLRSNLHSVPTDCPQRDERLGWTGDVNLFAATSCWLYDLRAFCRKWLVNVFDAQREDGRVMHTAPFDERVLPVEAAPVWGDVITVLPPVLHRFYDDRSLLKLAYGPMKRWVDWFASQATDGLPPVGGFGDWVSLEPTPPEMVGAAYFAYSSRLLADAAAVLGMMTTLLST